MTPWDIQGSELINCNCSYGCPCQFNALPTRGFCEAMGAISIEKGHFGEVPLDGLKIGVVFSWPEPIHEGKGKCQPVVDTNASPQQREALLKIMSGQEHRARIELPNDFEYEVAEIGSATNRSRGKLVVDLKDSYAQFAQLHMNNKGVVRHSAAV